jgi:predicted membrane-bound spermidine synthase
MSSAGGLVLEIVAGRLVAPYVGMSLYTWTAIIAVVLAGFSIGHWIGGRLAGPDCDAVTGARRVALALAFAAAASLGCLLLLRWFAPPLLSAGLPILAAIVLLATLLFLLPSLFIGIVSPILTKLAVDAASDPGRAIGRMYALGALGSIVGTLAAGYLFISWIGSTGTVIAVAAAYGVLALLFGHAGRAAGTVTAALAILAGGLGFAGARLDAFVSPCHVESDYYCIRVDDFRAASGRPSRVLVLDHLAHGINDRDDPRFLHSTYLQFLDEYARRRFRPAQPFEALVIGGGALTLPRAWAADRPAARILVAEIDPAVTRAAADHLWAPPHPRIEMMHGDGRVALQSLPPAPRFDVVFSDVYHDITMPAHVVTREFNREVRTRLKPGGFYAINVIEGGERPVFLDSLVRTLQEDFAAVEVWVDASDATRRGRITSVVIAADAASPFGALPATRPPARSWLRRPREEQAARIAASRVPVLTDDFAPVDRLLAHVLLDRELVER